MRKRPENSAFSKFYPKEGSTDTGRRSRNSQEGGRAIRRASANGERPARKSGSGSDRPFGKRPDGDRPFEKRPATERPFRKPAGENAARPLGKRPDSGRSFDKRPAGGGEKPFRQRPGNSGDRPFGRKTFSGRNRSDAGRPSFDKPEFGKRPFEKRASDSPESGKRPFEKRPFEKRPFGDRAFERPDAEKPAVENSLPAGQAGIPAKTETPGENPFQGKRNRRLKDQYKAVKKPFDRSVRRDPRESSGGDRQGNVRRDENAPSEGRTQAFRRREDTGTPERRTPERSAGSERPDKRAFRNDGAGGRENQRREKPFERRESNASERKTGRDISYREVKKLHEPGGAGTPEKRPLRREDSEKRPFDTEKRPFDTEKRPFDTEKRPFPKPFQRKEVEDKRESGADERGSDRKNSIREEGKTSGYAERAQKRPDYDRDIAQFEKNGKFNAKLKVADPNEEIRLNRYIANAGVCARREADELIKKGDIKVNDVVVSELGYKVKPGDVVKYGGRTLSREKMVYVLLNKPKDFITTTDDPDERKTVMDLVRTAATERIYPVGRLDRNTTGLLLLTNDGELAEKLSHPSHEIEKLYEVELDKPLTKDDFAAIMKGVELEDGLATVDDLAIVSPDNRSVGIALHLGRNRIVRRIFEHLGYQVERLDRTMYAGLTKKEVPRGNWRYLTEKEVIRLKFFV